MTAVMMRRAAAAYRAWRAWHPTRLQQHQRGDDELIRDQRMLSAARDHAQAEAMERRALHDEPRGPLDERRP